jgi:hypothetical protein
MYTKYVYSRGRSACTSGRRCRARALSRSAVAATAGTSLSCTPHGAAAHVRALGIRCRNRSHLAVVRASGGPSPRAGLRDLPSRACPPDPPLRACSQDVVDVIRQEDRIILVKLVVSDMILNLISVYVPSRL